MAPPKAFEGQVMQDLRGYLTLEEIAKVIDYSLIKVYPNKPGCRLRNHLFLIILSRTGRRVSEVLRITLNDIDLINGNIMFNILKKRKPLKKVKAIDSETLGLLKNYIETNKDLIEHNNGLLFPFKRDWARKIVYKIISETGFKFIGNKLPHPHHFRHSFAINMITNVKRSDTLRLVQQELEHTNLNITAQYLQFDTEEQRNIKEKLFVKKKVDINEEPNSKQ